MVGKTVSIKGQIVSREDIVLDGEIEGTIEALEHRVTVGPNGRVKASVRAREVLVLGQMLGNIEAGDRAEVRRDAKLVGDVRTSRVSIEDGAYFKGSIDIVRPDSLRADSKAAVAEPQTQAASSTLTLTPLSDTPVTVNAATAEAN